MTSQPPPPDPEHKLAPGTPKKPRTGAAAIVSIAVLATVAVGAIVWGVILTNDRNNQIDNLNATVANIEAENEMLRQASADAEAVSDAQIQALKSEVKDHNKALKQLGEISAQTLNTVSTEYDKVQTQLQASQTALRKLEQKNKDTAADADQIATAYAAAEQELRQTQDALAALLKAISAELSG